MLKPKLVIYSNTDYLDILNIQTDFVQKYSPILFINKNDLDLTNLFEKYETIIFYDNSLPYAKRVLDCLKQIKEDYILFTHDIDIILNINEPQINSIYDFMLNQSIDRIDLKHSRDLLSNLYVDINKNFLLSKELPESNNFMIRQTNVNNYIYNVNPSIWKKNTFLNVLQNFSHKNYRDIEQIDVQIFCMQFNIYKLYSKNFLKCGYFECSEFYKFLHISHSGKILSLNDKNQTEFGQSYDDCSSEFRNIVEKYNLKNSNKWR